MWEHYFRPRDRGDKVKQRRSSSLGQFSNVQNDVFIFQPGFIKHEKKYKFLKTITIKRNTFFQLNQVFIFFLLKVTQFTLPERQPQWLRRAENHLIFMTWPKLKSHLKTALLLFNAWFPNYGDGEAMVVVSISRCYGLLSPAQTFKPSRASVSFTNLVSFLHSQHFTEQAAMP